MQNLKVKTKSISLLALTTFAFSGCGHAFEMKAQSSVIGEVVEGITCSDARSKVFDSYYRAHENSVSLDGSTFKAAIKNSVIENAKLSGSATDVQERYEKALGLIHTLLTEDIRAAKTFAITSKPTVELDTPQEAEDDELLHLARLEMRSQIEPTYDVINHKLDAALKEASQAASEAGIACVEAVVTPPAAVVSPSTEVTIEGLASSNPLYGALYTMAASYQSCQVLDLAPVSASTTAAQGVVRGAKVDSVGYGREYTDVALLKRTHYYHRGQSYGPGCADQSRKPMVYDYGGRPAITGAAVDMFKNSGGGSALGIDCSAFVSTAAAVAGNLYKTSTANKPVYTRFVSRDFINPTTSKWTCYQSVRTLKSQSIRPGDIAAVKGHVVMIDKVGSDPFGISKAKTSAACSSLSTKNFDFTVIQSSPEKGSIGINRFVAKDYLAGGGKMSTMFLGYAKAACLSQFDGSTRNPVNTEYGIIRHSDSDTCVAQRMPLVNESCVQSCSALRVSAN